MDVCVFGMVIPIKLFYTVIQEEKNHTSSVATHVAYPSKPADYRMKLTHHYPTEATTAHHAHKIKPILMHPAVAMQAHFIENNGLGYSTFSLALSGA